MRTFSLRYVDSTTSPSLAAYTAVISEKTNYSVPGKPSNIQ